MRGRDREAGFEPTLLILLLAVGLIGLVAIWQGSKMRSKVTTGESSPLASMKTIVIAEEQYKSTAGGDCYATLSQLSATNPPYVDTVLGAGRKSGYCFRLFVGKPPGSGWFATACPVTLGKTGNRFFYLDQTGVIRWSLGVVASPASPPVE